MVESSICLANRFRMYMYEFLYIFSWICSRAFMFLVSVCLFEHIRVFVCVCVFVILVFIVISFYVQNIDLDRLVRLYVLYDLMCVMYS